MRKFAFVILHYNAIDETKKCIESVRALKGQEDIGIVVVDNASPNGSGKVLQSLYSGEAQIKILLRDQNDGFSRANNEGVLLAMKVFAPHFYIVTNNDTEFKQYDFTDRIEQEYQHSHFNVLGPDVYVPEKDIHQSPKRKEPPTFKEVCKTILFNRIFLAFYGFTASYMVNYFKKNTAKGTTMNHKEYQQKVCLVGACLIFDSNYVSLRIEEDSKCPVFAPETGFYFEEYLLRLWCDRRDLAIVYQPKLRVLHHDAVATGSSIRSDKERCRFIMQETLEAAKVYRKFVIGTMGMPALLRCINSLFRVYYYYG